jgi:lipoprotein-anchoring transpeptidase ErfK/SrfK
MISQTRMLLGTIGLLAFGMSASSAPARDQQGACGQIRAACLGAGFVQGAAREGIGLQVHCMMPIMQAKAQPAIARKPLPKVDPQLVADCKVSNLRFGPPLSPPAEIAEPLSASAASPGRDIVFRPPNSITSEQRTVISALPPEEQPETGSVKALPPQFRRTTIDYPSKEPSGTIVVDTPHTYLYLVLGNGKAIRYGIGVGREGFTWSGAEKVTKMAEWPDWHPPQEMIERQPYLPRFMAGGEGNPLGARTLYLGQTLYRIHGTNQPSTIGTFVSSGCIRLTNEDITDLYGRVQLGTRVVVLPGTPPASVQTTSNARPGQPPKQRPKAPVAERPATPLSGPPPQGPTAEAQTSKTDATASKSTTGTIPVTPAATAWPDEE